MAVLGKVDALVFTAGVGENDGIIRLKVCENLSNLGVEIDTEKNKSNTSEPFYIHTPDSPVQVWVIPANEELLIAKDVVKLLA